MSNFTAKYKSGIFFPTLALKKVNQSRALNKLQAASCNEESGRPRKKKKVEPSLKAALRRKFWKQSESAAQQAPLMHLSEDNGSKPELVV